MLELKWQRVNANVQEIKDFPPYTLKKKTYNNVLTYFIYDKNDVLIYSGTILRDFMRAVGDLVR